MTAFKPQFPGRVPDPDSVIREAMATKSDLLFCVSSMAEVCVRINRFWVRTNTLLRLGAKTRST